MMLDRPPSFPPLVEEAPVALVCNGSTLAVMMASPHELADFALGFALTEGIVASPQEVEDLEILSHVTGQDIGYEARFWLRGPAAERAAGRRRMMVGPVGCGLCGIDSLSNVNRTLPRLPEGALRLSRAEACAAPALLQRHQPDHDRTRASHAAGFLQPDAGIVLAREDVGRHNALDKLAGALALSGLDPASGALVLTSRVSTEMVQKAVAMRVPVVVAVSAATDYAVRLARRANLTLITRARSGDCQILTARQRVA